MKARIVLQSIAAAVAVMAAGAASATPVYPDFTVDTTALGGGGSLVPFVANDISGQYHETLTFTSATTFTVALNFTAQGFNYDDTNPAATKSYSAAQTGLGFNYSLLALFDGTGTYSTSGGVTTFSLNPGGALSLTYDKGANAFFNAPAGPGTGYTINANGDALTLLGGGNATSGLGSENCSAPNLCGSFGQASTFALTAAGSSFFVSPVPFYGITLQSGQFEGFPVAAGTTVTSSGSLNAVFAVPEPTGVALVGIALLGLGMAVTRRRTL
ncbi:MAG: flocculation-associated PEP-CTERM protein PepA [Vitreoscilla sp.]